MFRVCFAICEPSISKCIQNKTVNLTKLRLCSSVGFFGSKSKLNVNPHGVANHSIVDRSKRRYGISTTYFDSECKEKVVDGVSLVSKINQTWLRENCRCEECFTHATNQRNVLFHKVDAKVHPVEVMDDGGGVKIVWSDGHRSMYDYQWLKDNLYPGKLPRLQPHLWDAEEMKNINLPTVPYDEYLNNDDALKTMLESLSKYGVGLVNNVPNNVEGTQKVCERVSFIQETFFGRMWTFTADLLRGDTAYTRIALGAHTDSTYLSPSTGIQVFHCLKHDGTGGETLLVDGFKCAEMLRISDPDAFEMLSSWPICHEYTEPGIHVSSIDTILKIHPATKNLIQLRYNHYDRSPISTIPQDKVQTYYESLRKLSNLIESPAQEFWIKLKPGTVIFVDNWRVMHGRSAFTGNRSVCGCYLPRDDWISKARTLGIL